jgi:hypothetical protein
MSKRECNGHTKERLSNGVNRATRPEAPSGRDAAGRFQPGCAPGPGNPFARHAARLKHALLQAVDDTAGVRRVVEALVKRVERHGDLGAAKLLLLYAVGKPVKTCDPDSVDADEVARSQGVPLAAVLKTDAVTPAAALALLRVLQQMALQLRASGAVPGGRLLGTGGWDQVFEEMGDPQLVEWWQELCELQREAARAETRAGAKAGPK